MPPSPETAPSRKTTPAQRRVIRAAYATGEVTMEQLAALFHVSWQTIQKIVNGETWKDE